MLCRSLSLPLYTCEYCFFFFFKQKTAYEMRISDWSSDVCSSDLLFDRAIDFRGADAYAKPVQRRVRAAIDVAATASIDLDEIAMSPDVREHFRSDERREGKECVSTGRSRGSTYH